MIFILLPVYNEEENIGVLIDKICKGMGRSDEKFCIVAYNDGSSDDSLRLLEEKKADGLPITILGMAENRGLGYGLLTLLRYAAENTTDPEADTAVVLDSDNSHNPEHICTHMIHKIRDGFDLVIASRYLRDSRIVGVSRFRQWLSIGASLMMRVLFPITGVKDYTCGYRAYRVSVIQQGFRIFGNDLVTERSFACMAELLIKLGKMGVLAVEIPLLLRYDCKAGASKMKICKTIIRTLKILFRLKMLHVQQS